MINFFFFFLFYFFQFLLKLLLSKINLLLILIKIALLLLLNLLIKIDPQLVSLNSTLNFVYLLRQPANIISYFNKGVILMFILNKALNTEEFLIKLAISLDFLHMSWTILNIDLS